MLFQTSVRNRSYGHSLDENAYKIKTWSDSNRLLYKAPFIWIVKNSRQILSRAWIFHIHCSAAETYTIRTNKTDFITFNWRRFRLANQLRRKIVTSKVIKRRLSANFPPAAEYSIRFNLHFRLRFSYFKFSLVLISRIIQTGAVDSLGRTLSSFESALDPNHIPRELVPPH